MIIYQWGLGLTKVLVVPQVTGRHSNTVGEYLRD